jgi:hypothetical protein
MNFQQSMDQTLHQISTDFGSLNLSADVMRGVVAMGY